MPNRRPKSRKLPNLTGDKHVDKALKGVYDDINKLIESVNSPVVDAEVSTRDGKPGDLRIVRDSSYNLSDTAGNDTYFLEAKTDVGWVRQYFDRVEHSGISRDGTIPIDLLKSSLKKHIKQGRLSFWKSNAAYTKSGLASVNVYIDENVEFNGGLYIKERATPLTYKVAYGQLYIKNESPCELWFQTDGNDNIQITDGTSLASGVTLGGHTMNDIDIGSEFTDVDDHLMTSGAIKEKIENYGYAALSGSTDNTICTVTGANAFQGEANLQFVSDTLTMSSAVASKPQISLLNTEDDATAGNIIFTKNRSSAAGTDGDLLGQLIFYGEDGSSNLQTYASIEASIAESAHGDEAGILKFRVASGASTYGTPTPDALVLTGAKAGQTHYVPDGHCELQITDTVVGFVQEALTNSATGTTTNFDVDFRKCNKFHLTSAGDITNLKCYFPSVSGNFLLIINHGGGDQITNWKSFDEASGNETNFHWPDGNKFLCTATAAVDIVSIYWDSTNHIAYGMAAMDFKAP